MTLEIVTGDAATTNVADEPFNILLYGPPGIGKTTEAVKTFVKNGKCTAFFIPCEDGGLKSIIAAGLPVPDHVKDPVKSWEGLFEAMSLMTQHKNRYTGVIIDGFTTWMAYVYRSLEEAYKNNPGAFQHNKYAIPTTMRNLLFNLREGARNLGLHVVFTAHILPPHTEPPPSNQRFLGGPAFTPKRSVELFFGVLDTVLRMDYHSTLGQPAQRVFYTGGVEWPRALGMPPADLAEWRAKNREGCNWAIVPADLKAFLSARKPPYRGI